MVVLISVTRPGCTQSKAPFTWEKCVDSTLICFHQGHDDVPTTNSACWRVVYQWSSLHIRTHTHTHTHTHRSEFRTTSMVWIYPCVDMPSSPLHLRASAPAQNSVAIETESHRYCVAAPPASSRCSCCSFSVCSRWSRCSCWSFTVCSWWSHSLVLFSPCRSLSPSQRRSLTVPLTVSHTHVRLRALCCTMCYFQRHTVQ